MSSRCVVVCRPLPSARTSAVASASLPDKRFTSVDLPVPLGPTSTATRPSSRISRRRASPAPDALTAMTSAPAATDRAARRSSSTSSLRSDLVSRTTGAAPLDHAIASARSMRRSRSGTPSATVMKTRSMLAATAWPAVATPAARRMSTLRRGSSMHGDAVVDDQPVAGGDASIVRDAGERRCKRDALLAGIGQDRDHAPVDADDEAPAAVGGGVSERGFESAVPPERGETVRIVRQVGTPCCSESPEPRLQSRTRMWREVNGRSGGGAAGHDVGGGRCRRNRKCHVCALQWSC